MQLVQSHFVLWQFCSCRAICAFEKGNYTEAVRLWSIALGLNEGNAAGILCNRSSAYAHQALWTEALLDARQVTIAVFMLYTFVTRTVFENSSSKKFSGLYWPTCAFTPGCAMSHIWLPNNSGL